MTCPACGATTSEGSRFCPSCGSALDLGSTPTVTDVETPAGRAEKTPEARSSASRPGWLSSSSAGENVRFAPGTLLEDRYLVLTALQLGGENFWLEAPLGVAQAAMITFVLLRFGILAVTASSFSLWILTTYPLTLDFSRWYATRSLFALFVFVGATLYAFRAALGGGPIFGASALDD